jgi:transposase
MPRSTVVATTTVYENKKKQAQEIYKKVVESRVNEDLSYSAIARKLKITKTSVFRHLDRWRKGVPVEEITPNCRPQKITPQLRQTLGQIIARSDVPTSKSLAKDLSAKSGTSIAPRTIRTHLSSYMGYKSSVPRAVPLLTSLQQKKSVEWCLQQTP